MKRLAEKTAVLGAENSKGQFVKIKINVQTQKTKEFQNQETMPRVNRSVEQDSTGAKPGGEHGGNYDA